ncbi:type II toxin-antitoxin system PemK/MazF family toxin [Neglecta sp. X4]|uniref:type II toxin-antitoxin system PemK/MazF family toxin n=1 Tax=unclassified Neglectibacter TaxID=2632164 RepID=UPI00136E3A66|nr:MULTISPECIES: type II toxin-antitoxin system PemK/MazF family toxin [unclassified Neglectibacter]NBI18908.1 type II toxin-antitoxin system PemK/MazF family toxin [Neglectibacter sp. 59]NBJ74582.1 type II toxin-antitoxin system PemK/MazF family toxin [Neglectibacter sp. X4]NCE82398.1 type II toxin-antitoxin system PemK/MazF family toxin [Neglectibacter sp. X58]
MQTENKEKVKRGEIYLHDFGNNAGSIQNGVRPVLVVQCDEGNQASTTSLSSVR